MKASEAKSDDLIAVLSQLRQMRPEWRLGQTIANLAMTAGRLDAGAVWDLEDDEALAAAKKLIQQFSRDERGVAAPVDAVGEKGAESFQHS
jgi:hypothetical protein